MPASPAVVRRRRAVALGGLAAVVAVPVALLAGGGPASDRETIGRLLERGAERPRTLCAHLSAGMLEAAGGREGCLRASPERGPGGRVANVQVEGARATAVVTGEAGDKRVVLVRQGGAWRVDDVR